MEKSPDWKTGDLLGTDLSTARAAMIWNGHAIMSSHGSLWYIMTNMANMGKLTISIEIFNSKLLNDQRVGSSLEEHLPSGYVKITMKHGHRNSGCAH